MVAFEVADDIFLGESVRVADESETKTFRCTGTVLVRQDGEWFTWTNPVRVTDSCDRVIGCVVLEDDARGVIDGEFFLDYYTPERLNLETGAHKLHPRVYTKLIDTILESKVPVSEVLESEKLFEITRLSLIEMSVGDPL